MPSWCGRREDGVWIVRVHAQPGARRSEVAGLHGDALKVRIAAPALEDRANAALIELIAERLGISRRDVTLASGAHSREKVLEIANATADPSRLLA